MIRLTTHNILVFGTRIGSFGKIGETFILTFPFPFTLVIIAQAHVCPLLRIVGKGQTDGQGQVQFGNEITLSIL